MHKLSTLHMSHCSKTAKMQLQITGLSEMRWTGSER